MSWTVVYSAHARQDLRNIYEYIAYKLLAPNTASSQVEQIIKGIRSLEEMPLRYRLYDDEPWHSMGLRFFPVNNYLIFYLPDEEDKIVKVVRIMYGGRDISKQLNDTHEV